MAKIRIRDPYLVVHEIDESALPFWEGREGYEVLEPEPAAGAVAPQDAPSDGREPDEAGRQPESAQAGHQQPDEPGDPKTTTRKAAIRAAQDVKEQPGG